MPSLLSFSAPGTALAEPRNKMEITPPLYREQSRDMQRVRSLRDLTITPQPVRATHFDETVGEPTTTGTIVERQTNTTGMSRR
jgi:hypothetical protein